MAYFDDKSYNYSGGSDLQQVKWRNLGKWEMRWNLIIYVCACIINEICRSGGWFVLAVKCNKWWMWNAGLGLRAKKWYPRHDLKRKYTILCKCDYAIPSLKCAGIQNKIRYFHLRICFKYLPTDDVKQTVDDKMSLNRFLNDSCAILLVTKM